MLPGEVCSPPSPHPRISLPAAPLLKRTHPPSAARTGPCPGTVPFTRHLSTEVPTDASVAPPRCHHASRSSQRGHSRVLPGACGQGPATSQPLTTPSLGEQGPGRCWQVPTGWRHPRCPVMRTKSQSLRETQCDRRNDRAARARGNRGLAALGSPRTRWVAGAGSTASISTMLSR